MRPLDQKLSYQINKLLKMATLGDVNVAGTTLDDFINALLTDLLKVDAKLKYRPQIDDLAEDAEEGDENVDGKILRLLIAFLTLLPQRKIKNILPRRSRL